jgi:ABC-type phosphate transport system substrate-binding protein
MLGTRIQKWAQRSVSALWFAVLILAVPATDSAAQVAVIAHPDAPADTLSNTRLLDFYTGDVQTWNGEIAVVFFDLKPRTEVKKTFYHYLGKSPSRMKSIWMKRLLAGEGEPPQTLGSNREMLEKVAATPGAIGFAHRDSVRGPVKILAIIPNPSR